MLYHRFNICIHIFLLFFKFIVFFDYTYIQIELSFRLINIQRLWFPSCLFMRRKLKKREGAVLYRIKLISLLIRSKRILNRSETAARRKCLVELFRGFLRT